MEGCGRYDVCGDHEGGAGGTKVKCDGPLSASRRRRTVCADGPGNGAARRATVRSRRRPDVPPFTFAKGDYDDEFNELDQAIDAIAKSIPGYLGEEAWESPSSGLISTISTSWKRWKRSATRSPSRRSGLGKEQQARWINGYHVVVAEVIKSYGDRGIHSSALLLRTLRHPRPWMADSKVHDAELTQWVRTACQAIGIRPWRTPLRRPLVSEAAVCRPSQGGRSRGILAELSCCDRGRSHRIAESSKSMARASCVPRSTNEQAHAGQLICSKRRAALRGRRPRAAIESPAERRRCAVVPAATTGGHAAQCRLRQRAQRVPRRQGCNSAASGGR